MMPYSWFWFWTTVGIWTALSVSLASVRAADPADSQGILKLANGGVIPGEFRASPTEGEIRWQGGAFTQPFDFVPGTVRSVLFPQLSKQHLPRNAHAEFMVELAGGVRLAGSITNWSHNRISLATAEFGTVQIDTDALRRVSRVEGNPQLVFSGLSGLDGWTASGSDWETDGSVLLTSVDKASLMGDQDLPDQAMIEFEIAWEKDADFVFILAAPAGQSEDKPTSGWRFETWNGVLALVREQANKADLAAIRGFNPKDKRVQLIVFLDQIAGNIHVYHTDGSLAAELKLPPELTPGKQKNTEKPGKVRLINRHGDVRLEQLRISRWNGKLPSAIPQGEFSIELMDDRNLTGKVTGFETENQTLSIQSGAEQSAVKLKDVLTIQRRSSESIPSRTASLLLQNGTQLSGNLKGTGEDKLSLACPSIDEPLEVPYSSIRSLSLREEHAKLEPPVGRAGRLSFSSKTSPSATETRETPKAATDAAQQAQIAIQNARLQVRVNAAAGAMQAQVIKPGVPSNSDPTKGPARPETPDQGAIPGRLVNGAATSDASCLVWHPDGSRTASPLQSHVSGQIFYRTPPSPVEVSAATSRNENAGQNFATLFLKKAAEPVASPRPGGSHSIHLRSGDVILCQVQSIDDTGVSITSQTVETQLIPHSKIKALELVSTPIPPDLLEAKNNRLLTVPRLQKLSPPTHLLCAGNGDFLRCRLLGMSEGHLSIEVQLAEVDLPLNRVSQIIWFHPDEMEQSTDDPEKTQQPAEHEFAGQVQVLSADRKRATFVASRVNDETIFGTSDVLGDCRFELSRVDQLIFGTQIQAVAAQLPYHQWRLSPAVEPLVAQDAGEGGIPPGSDSPLIGQAAPEIDLVFLDGGKFKLSQHRGQIIVLDFWATWCGPCMQTIPLLHELMAEFDPQQVRLISVNLEEPAERVRSVLDRHQFQLQVALDIDGVAARRYQANAIPQLVVVDREGQIVQLLIGGGPNTINRLRTALTEQLSLKNVPP